MLDSKPARVPVPGASACDGDVAPPSTRSDVHTKPTAWAPFALARIVVAIVSAAALWFELPEPFPVRLPAGVSLIGLGALVFVGWPIAREAFANLFVRRMTMELSMLIALAAAASIGEYFTALVIAVFVLIAEELEHLTVARGRSALHDLVAFVPPEARVRRGEGIQLVPVATLVPGDLVLVGPGEKIAVDGTVTDGHSTVDQSRITGESMPQEKAPGAHVFAGSINHTGALEIAVGSVGRDTSYGRIIEAVEAAEHMRAPAQRLADRLAGYLVYFSFAAAAATYLVTADVRATISVIIVAGACGIAAGTPLAILGGIGRAARLGAIVKGGVHLETLGKVDTIVLDKTGTLTFGEPALEAIRPAAGIDETGLLAAIAAAEFHSEHPLARAVTEAARERGLAPIPPVDFSATPGRGITAQIGGRTWLVGNRRFLEEHSIAAPPSGDPVIGSEILAAEEGVYRGEIIVADRLRPEAAPAMAALARLGIRTVLLSGDVRAVAQKVGATLGITEVGADMLPQDKHARIRDLTAQGRVVAMVGDGINDAPALSAASIGIAMGSGTDVAKESAAVVLIGNDLAKLVETLEIARKTRAIIWQNFAGTLAVDALGMALAATGQLDPLLAAFIHVGSEFAFLSNSARLLPAAGRWRAPLRRRAVRAPAKALSDHLDAG